MTKPAKPKNQAERKARVQVILKTLDEMYPNATCALIHRNPWELHSRAALPRAVRT